MHSVRVIDTTATTPETARLAPGAPLAPVALAAGVLKGRWTPFILWNLFWGGRSFYQLARSVPGLPRRALSRELSDLEQAGLIQRRRRHPDRVEFSFAASPVAQRLRLLVAALYDWGLVAGRELEIAELAASKLSGIHGTAHPRLAQGDVTPAGAAASSDKTSL